MSGPAPGAPCAGSPATDARFLAQAANAGIWRCDPSCQTTRQRQVRRGRRPLWRACAQWTACSSVFRHSCRSRGRTRRSQHMGQAQQDPAKRGCWRAVPWPWLVASMPGRVQLCVLLLVRHAPRLRARARRQHQLHLLHRCLHATLDAASSTHPHIPRGQAACPSSPVPCT